MGCFNITGFHTQIPLTCGDEAFIIPGIYRPLDKRKEFATGNIFCPIALPIFGSYDDYGKIENIEINENTKIIEDIFKVSIEDFIKIVDDHSADRYESPTKSVKYKDLVSSYLNYIDKNKPRNLWFEFDKELDSITFNLDHRFFYDSCSEVTDKIRENFNVNITKTLALRKAKENKIKEFDKLLDNLKHKISEEEYKDLSELKNSFNTYGARSLSLDPNIRTGWIFGSGFGNYHRSDNLLSLYFGQNSDLLFNQLKEDYIKFILFFETFEEHSWIFDMHNYCNQNDNTGTLFPIYKKMFEFIKEKKEKYK